MAVLARFVKVMLFVTFLGVLGVVLFVVAMTLTSPGGLHLSQGVSREEFTRTVSGALGLWFGMIFFMGFIVFFAGLPKRFTVSFDDREAFLARLDAAARSVRYRPRGSDGDRLVFKPPFYALLAEKMTATVGAGEAEISAPVGLRKKLEKKLA